MKSLVIASDHAGVELKKTLGAFCLEARHVVVDLGTHNTESVDYSDYANLLIQYMQKHKDHIGVLICGSGIGMSMVANRYFWIRAALCRCSYETKVARLHNNANVLCLGSHVTGVEVAKDCLQTFLATGFEGGRHQRRIDKF